MNLSKQSFEAAKHVLVGGVNSPVRAYNAVGGDPVFITSGSGATVTSQDGQTFIDYNFDKKGKHIGEQKVYYPNGKLRLLYEVLPFSYIFKIAGGIGLDNNYNNILDIYKNFKINNINIHKTVPIILCSNKEHKKLLNYFDVRENIFC